MKLLIQMSPTSGAIKINDLKNKHYKRHYIKKSGARQIGAIVRSVPRLAFEARTPNKDLIIDIRQTQNSTICVLTKSLSYNFPEVC
jgi:hypothetical protein